MTPDSRAGGGLGAAILPLAAHRAGRRRGAGGGGGAGGAQAGEERAPQPLDNAAAASASRAAAPGVPRTGRCPHAPPSLLPVPQSRSPSRRRSHNRGHYGFWSYSE